MPNECAPDTGILAVIPSSFWLSNLSRHYALSFFLPGWLPRPLASRHPMKSLPDELQTVLCHSEELPCP